MAALIPGERSVVLANLNIFLAQQNVTVYIWDRCCHQQGYGAPLAPRQLASSLSMRCQGLSFILIEFKIFYKINSVVVRTYHLQRWWLY